MLKLVDTYPNTQRNENANGFTTHLRYKIRSMLIPRITYRNPLCCNDFLQSLRRIFETLIFNLPTSFHVVVNADPPHMGLLGADWDGKLYLPNRAVLKSLITRFILVPGYHKRSRINKNIQQRYLIVEMIPF